MVGKNNLRLQAHMQAAEAAQVQAAEAAQRLALLQQWQVSHSWGLGVKKSVNGGQKQCTIAGPHVFIFVVIFSYLSSRLLTLKRIFFFQVQQLARERNVAMTSKLRRPTLTLMTSQTTVL